LTKQPSPLRIYEACFVEMGKSLRTAQFYPTTHPAFRRSLERSFLYLSQLLKRIEHIDLTINKSHLMVDGRRITGNTKVLGFLANELFRRRIKELHVELGANLDDYQALFSVLVSDAQEVQSRGGPERVLAAHGARHIWANAMRFEANQITEFDDDPTADEQAPEAAEEAAEQLEDLMAEVRADHQQLHELLERIDDTDDPQALAELVEAVVAYLQSDAEGAQAPACAAFRHLAQKHQAARDDATTQKLLLDAVRAVASRNVVEHEISALQTALGKAWEFHGEALRLVGPTTVPFLLAALAATDSRKERERLLAVLHRFGRDVLKPAVRLLEDQRWFVLRNALDLIGHHGSSRLLPAVTMFLSHEHPRVRQAAREATRRLGSDEALQQLLPLTEKGEDADRRHAVAQLAFFPPKQVLPILIERIDDAPAIVADEALRILSELDPPDMIDFLERQLKAKRRLFGRRKHAMLRRTAAELICLRLPDTWPTLKAYATDRDPEIRKWVERGVSWMRKLRRQDTQPRAMSA